MALIIPDIAERRWSKFGTKMFGSKKPSDCPSAPTNQLTPSLIRERFYDLQVFGWATVLALRVDDRFQGEARLVDTFEATAWNGQATTSTCHWIRGFLTGALSSLTGSTLQVSEPECQGKGDRYCRMTFRTA